MEQNKQYECKECAVLWDDEKLGDSLFCPDCGERLSIVEPRSIALKEKEADLTTSNNSKRKDIAEFNVILQNVDSSPCNFFQKKDPIDGRGRLLPELSVASSYSVDVEFREKLPIIRQEIIHEIISKINSGFIGNVKSRVVDYQDLSHNTNLFTTET